MKVIGLKEICLCASAMMAMTSAASGDEYPTDAYFGDTHVHTGWSADAGFDGAVKTPVEAYRLASGEEVIANSNIKVK